MNYTIEQKMRGEDLHGLPRRVPEPTAEQAKCSHTKMDWIEGGMVDDGWGDKEYRDGFWVEESACVDIPGTNNFRCTKCGYTRRY